MTHKPDPTTWTVVSTTETSVTTFAMCVCGDDCGWTTTSYRGDWVNQRENGATVLDNVETPPCLYPGCDSPGHSTTEHDAYIERTDSASV